MKKSIFSAGLMFLGAVLLVVSLLMTGPKADKVMAAMMGMAKIDIQALKDAGR